MTRRSSHREWRAELLGGGGDGLRCAEAGAEHGAHQVTQLDELSFHHGAPLADAHVEVDRGEHEADRAAEQQRERPDEAQAGQEGGCQQHGGGDGDGAQGDVLADTERDTGPVEEIRGFLRPAASAQQHLQRTDAGDRAVAQQADVEDLGVRRAAFHLVHALEHS